MYTYNKTPQYPKKVVRKQTKNGKFIANNNYLKKASLFISNDQTSQRG